MPQNLHGRSFLKLLDFTPAEIRALLVLARDLKAAKRAGTEQARLRGKNIALIFEKDSTRTRQGSRSRPMIRAHMSPASARRAATSATRKR